MKKNYDTTRPQRKPERILLVCVLLMQVAIFIAIIHSRSSFSPQKAKTDLSTTKINTNSQPTNHIISSFSVIDQNMEKLMQQFFNSSRQSHRHVRNHQRIMQQTINNAMQEMAFFSDLMNIDSGWDAINISPAMDMREKKNTYEITVSIPCGTESNVIVELNGQLLNMYIPIQITKPGYNELRTYKQQILIPGPINTNTTIKAAISNNVLRVIIPKR